MATLPTRADIVDANTTNAEQKVNFGDQRDFIADFLGTDSADKPAARALLEVPPQAIRIDVASVAGTVDITANAPDTDDIRITGALAITQFTVAAGRVLRVTAGGAFTLANNANIVTQTGGTLLLAAGDTFSLRATAADVVEVLFLTRAGSSPVSVPKRRTVLSGDAAFLVIGTGLSVNLAAATPLRISIAAGMGANGAIDYVATHSVAAAAYWSGLTANVVNYLYENRDATTGVLSGVSSVLPEIWQDSAAAISTTNGQHTWVYDVGQMYVGNGASATAVQRTPVGQCLAGAATITSVTPYAKMRRYRSGHFAVAAGNFYSKSHNLGVPVNFIKKNITIADDAAGTNDRILVTAISGGIGFWERAATDSRLQIDITTAGSNVGYGTGAVLTAIGSAFYNVICEAD